MPFREALGFLDGLEPTVKCNYLALFSTFPYYLASIDRNKTFDENVISLLFNQYGTFFTFLDQLLSNSTKVQDVYNAILTAIAHRRRTNKEIADYIHEEESKVAKHMLTLLENELVIKCETFMGNRKTFYYEIGDPLLRFWYTFIFDEEERIRTNGLKVFTDMKEDIHQFIAQGFEEISRLFIDQLNMDSALPDVFEKPKVYRVEKSTLGRSIELDGLSLSNDILLVMECKYRKTPFTAAMLEHLIESTSVFPDKYRREYYLFSRNGFDEQIRTIADPHIHLFELSDLFTP